MSEETEIEVPNPMPPSAIINELIDNIKVNLASFVWGSPGTGKSDIINQVVQMLGIGIVDIRVAGKDPVDMSGLPSVEDRKQIWNIPDMLPNAERDGEFGVLFLDELTSAVPAMQTVAYQLVLEGKCGDYTLPPGWNVIAAGNYSTDRAVVYRQSTALANRFGHYDLVVDNEEWINWAISTGISEDIIAFIKHRPTLLHKMDTDQRAFPTPRTWENVNRHMQFMTPENEYNKVSAFVGKGAAIEFNHFMKIARSLATFDEIIQNPSAAKISNIPATNHTIAALLMKNVTPGNFEQVMKYVRRIPQEFQAVFVLDAVKRNEELVATRSFIDWADTNNTQIM